MRQTLFLLLAVGLSNSVLAQAASETNGKAVFDKWCAPCHGAVAPKNVMFGSGALAGTSALAVKYKGKLPYAYTRRTEVSDAELLRRNGVPGPQSEEVGGTSPQAPIPPIGSRYVTVKSGSHLFPLVFTE